MNHKQPEATWPKPNQKKNPGPTNATPLLPVQHCQYPRSPVRRPRLLLLLLLLHLRLLWRNPKL
jgi:hypothetical protein